MIVISMTKAGPQQGSDTALKDYFYAKFVFSSLRRRRWSAGAEGEEGAGKESREGKTEAGPEEERGIQA